jgi:hypothetical protein
MHDNRPIARIFDTLLLIASASVAGEVWHARRERLAGRDPSEQESPADARGHLARQRPVIDELASRLRVAVAYRSEHDEDVVTTTARDADALITLHRLAVELHRMHQRLLSLYPAVSESLPEEARRLAARCRELLEREEHAAFEDLLDAADDIVVLSYDVASGV